MALDKLTKVQSVGISSFIQVVGVVTATQGFDGNITGIITATGDLTFGANSKAKLFENGTQSGVQATNSGSSAHLMTHDGNEDIHVDPSGYIKVEVAGSERLRIASDGTVIVGTDTTVNPILRVLGTSAHNSFIQFADGDSTNVGQLQYSHSSNALIVAVNSAERLRITSDGKIGIGIANPDATLKVNVASGNNGVVVQNTSTANIALFGARNGDATLQVGQWGSTASGTTFGLSNANLAFIYTTTYNTTHPSALALGTVSNKPIVFATNNTERLRIQENGDIGVGGITSPSFTTGNGLHLGDNYAIGFGAGGNSRPDFQIVTDGSSLDFRCGFGADTADISMTTGGNLVFANGGGIDFSATANSSGTMTSELLDDYEEGTWTPVLVGSSSSPSLTYGAQGGAYEKIGTLVHASFFIYVSAVNSQGNGQLRINGLPYSNASGINAGEVPGVLLQSQPFGDGKAANRDQFVRSAGSSFMFVGYRDLTNGNAVIPSNAAANVDTGYFIGHITYRAS